MKTEDDTVFISIQAALQAKDMSSNFQLLQVNRSEAVKLETLVCKGLGLRISL